MMIDGMFESGALPVLERVAQFTTARHRVLTDNVANLSTPYFKPRELDPKGFQAALRDAVEQRRNSARPISGELRVSDTEQLRFTEKGVEIKPTESHEGILFHDRNNRDLERTMQHLAENALAHNSAVEMLRNQFAVLSMAVKERV